MSLSAAAFASDRQLAGGERTCPDALAESLGNDLASLHWFCRPRRAKSREQTAVELRKQIASEARRLRKRSALGAGSAERERRLGDASQ